ncbi:MAG: protein translocase subunit SecD [Tissierella sp.]|uniref:protein translocase subunit SecD n=1 Tax=Tissierella sp. TaxID=41274 RepID=UPI003F969AA9
MKNKNIIILVLIVAIVAGGVFVALEGIQVGDFKLEKAKDEVELGLELAGGVYVVLEAETDAKGEELRKLMEQTKAILSQRVDGLGIADPTIVIEGEKRIRLELAGAEDPQEAIDLIGKTAQLQFIDPNDNVVISGKNVTDADVAFQQNAIGKEVPVVTLELDKEGTKRFGDTTGDLILEEKDEDRIIYIVLDGEVISAPLVSNIDDGGKPIDDGKAVITGNFDIDTANNLATLIRAGSLPVELTEQTTSLIGPSLGLEAYETSIKAGGIALLIIFLFMILMYKIPGLIASLSLTVYTLLTVYIMIILGVKLTLPGILGLILSIGMAVDANVLIFERIREELLLGKSLRVSVDSGFKKALSSVVDSNVTTLIAGAVLYYFGTGPIKGFGITLIIGIVVSVLTAIIISRSLLKIVASLSNSKNIKYFGA